VTALIGSNFQRSKIHHNLRWIFVCRIGSRSIDEFLALINLLVKVDRVGIKIHSCGIYIPIYWRPFIGHSTIIGHLWCLHGHMFISFILPKSR